MSLAVVCVKPVPLGEPSVARGQLVLEGMAWGLPPSERRTLAAARAASEALGLELVALALAPAQGQAGLREALALGAQRAVLVESEGRRLDALLTARALAAAVRKLGPPHLVLTGSESADAQQGLLGPMLAEMLGLDLVAQVEALQGTRAGLDLHRGAGGEDEHVVAKPPLLLTIAPRFSPTPHATSWGVGEAWVRPLQTWRLADLALRPEELEPASDVAGLARAEQAKASAERFEGDVEEATSQLVRRLRAGGWVR